MLDVVKVSIATSGHKDLAQSPLLFQQDASMDAQNILLQLILKCKGTRTAETFVRIK